MKKTFFSSLLISVCTFCSPSNSTLMEIEFLNYSAQSFKLNNIKLEKGKVLKEDLNFLNQDCKGNFFVLPFNSSKIYVDFEENTFVELTKNHVGWICRSTLMDTSRISNSGIKGAYKDLKNLSYKTFWKKMENLITLDVFDHENEIYPFQRKMFIEWSNIKLPFLESSYGVPFDKEDFSSVGNIKYYPMTKDPYNNLFFKATYESFPFTGFIDIDQKSMSIKSKIQISITEPHIDNKFLKTTMKKMKDLNDLENSIFQNFYPSRVLQSQTFEDDLKSLNSHFINDDPNPGVSTQSNSLLFSSEDENEKEPLMVLQGSSWDNPEDYQGLPVPYLSNEGDDEERERNQPAVPDMTSFYNENENY